MRSFGGLLVILGNQSCILWNIQDWFPNHVDQEIVGVAKVNKILIQILILISIQKNKNENIEIIYWIKKFYDKISSQKLMILK